jgi:hypothetical protein
MWYGDEGRNGSDASIVQGTLINAKECQEMPANCQKPGEQILISLTALEEANSLSPWFLASSFQCCRKYGSVG